MSLARPESSVPFPSSPANPTPLVGRARERAILAERLAAATRGRGSVALISGEPGVGKSRLLDVLAADALAAGAVALRGGASDAAGMPPYLPFVEALGRRLREAPDTIDALAETQFAASLATMLPELAAQFPGREGRLPLPPEQERFRLFEAVGDLLDAVAGDALLLLILDDLHWADASTLDLLCSVARREPARRLLIAGAFREGEVERNPAFARTFAELSRLRVLSTIALSPLARDEIARLATASLGASLDPASIAMLADRSGGNPFFAEELLRHWQESGAVAAGPGGARVTASPSEIPVTIRATVAQRTSRLEPGAADLLRTAAIVGRSVDVSTLAAATGIDPEQVESLLFDGVHADLLRATPDGGFRFGHDTVREALAADLAPLRRRRLHGFLARAIEQVEGERAERRAAEIAFHCVRSGDRERARTWSSRAAAQSLQAAAFSEAVAHFRNARAATDDDDSGLGSLLLALGEAETLADDDAAATTLAAAADRFRTSGDIGQTVRALRLLGQAHARRERHADARIAFESALAMPRDGAGRERLETLISFGALLTASLHDYDQAFAALDEAAQQAAASGEPGLTARAHRAMGNLRVRQGELRAGIALLETALGIAEAMGDSVEAAECCGCLAPAWFWLGEVERSAAITLRRLDHAERTRDPYQLRHVFTWLAICSGIRGRIVEAHRWLERAAGQVASFASPEPAAFLDFVKGALASVQDDHEEAVRLLESAIARFRAIGPGALVWYLGWLGIAYVQAGEPDRADDVLAELEGLLTGMPPEDAPGEALALVVQIALLRDDRPRLERHGPALRRLRGRFHDALVDRLLGEIALRAGDLAEAGALLSDAEAVARRERMPYELSRTLEAKATLATLAGRPADAAAFMRTAAETLERAGSVQRARQLRERALPGAAPQREERPAGLTPRELEVLRAVTAGKSNREIAAALFLSEKTVERHLSNIYAKTGVENRAAAAAFAIRGGFV